MSQAADLTFEDRGSGAPALVLHGGGGPLTVAALVAHLAQDMRVLAPTHPGWNGTPRPKDFNHVADIAAAYLGLLRDQGLRDVLVVGSSMGGWIAAEMACQDAEGPDSEGLIGGIVLVNAVGIAVASQPIPDFFALTPRQVAEHSFHDPDRFFVDPASFPPERRALQAANMAAMRAFAGAPYMHDPSLPARLGSVQARVQLIWGEADRLVTPAYGRAYAAAFPGAAFALVPQAGHLPQIEQPTATFALIDAFRRGG